MANYRVGIDFGTSQTKICSINLKDINTYVFHKFSFNKAYMLPTTIKLNEDGTLSYGLNELNLIRYFKMASLFEENADYQIERNKGLLDDKALKQEVLQQYPEICSILYLTYCILDVKESFKPQSKKKVGFNDGKSSNNLLSRLFRKKSEVTNIETNIHEMNDSNNFNFTIGVPTQYDTNQHEYKRRSKQYEMLYLSKKLSEDYTSILEYTKVNIQIILEQISHHYDAIKNNHTINEDLYLRREGLYIVAETTAGIVPIRNQMQKNPQRNLMGNYITMDVGAGTTDISFFKFYLNEFGTIRMKYYASKSIDLASNRLILNYLNTNNLNVIHQFNYVKAQGEQWRASQRDVRKELFNKIRHPENNLYYRVTQIFNKTPRIYWHWEYPIAKGCKVYGGGSRFNEFNSGNMQLHNGGHPGVGFSTETKLNKFINTNEMKDLKIANSLNKELAIDSTDFKIIFSHLDMLIIALGLAQVDFGNRPDGENGWIDPIEGLPNDPIENDNKGMANYDVFNRDWI